MHVADLHPLFPAEIGRLCVLAVRALDFDDTAAFAWLRGVVALLGDISIGPEPESAMNLYIVSMARVIDTERLTEVALRTTAA
jgi:hypothetical protein